MGVEVAFEVRATTDVRDWHERRLARAVEVEVAILRQLLVARQGEQRRRSESVPYAQARHIPTLCCPGTITGGSHG